MKPAGAIARRAEYALEPVRHGSARALIGAYHYAGSAANTSVHAHGMFRLRDRVLVGAVLWMPPTANAAKAMARLHMADESRHREVLALSRCVLTPNAPKNLAGMMLAASRRLVADDDRWSLYVTYADEGEQHVGTIYTATGWAFDGRTKPETRWLDGGGASCLRSRPARAPSRRCALSAARHRARPSCDSSRRLGRSAL